MGLSRSPIVLQRHVIDDQLAVESHADLIAHHLDVERVPLTNGLIGHFQRSGRVFLIVEEAAPSQNSLPA